MRKVENIPMPNGKSKREIIELLLSEEYGYLPDVACSVSAMLVSEDELFCAGKAVYRELQLSLKMENGTFSLPIYYVQLLSGGKTPCIVQINFRSNVPDKYQPTEEIIDAGYSIISFNYEDVTSDSADFTDKLAGYIYKNGERALRDCGKIGLWAWALMRVIDFAVTLPEIDASRISVAGHSRLGKTALLAGALDDRIYCAYSNDSGCSGAAISRGKGGERIADICRQFGYWFSKRYEMYVNNEKALPFDQHFLIAANAPHRVYVASARGDGWADPESEYLSCVLAAPYYEEHGLASKITPKMPNIGRKIKNGYIGYHIRAGKHYFSREDWKYFLEYLENCYKEDAEDNQRSQ